LIGIPVASGGGKIACMGQFGQIGSGATQGESSDHFTAATASRHR
jgi:hypothetical protein